MLPSKVVKQVIPVFQSRVLHTHSGRIKSTRNSRTSRGWMRDCMWHAIHCVASSGAYVVSCVANCTSCESLILVGGKLEVQAC